MYRAISPLSIGISRYRSTDVPMGAVTGFIQHNWQWILSTLAAGIGLAWKFFGSKKKESPGGAAS